MWAVSENYVLKLWLTGSWRSERGSQLVIMPVSQILEKGLGVWWYGGGGGGMGNAELPECSVVEFLITETR